MSAATEPDLPAPRLASLQAVFRFASIGRGDPGSDEALYQAVREHFPLRLVQRTNMEPPPQAPHIVLSSTTAQMAVGITQADVLMQLQDAEVSSLTELAGGLLESVRGGLVAGGIHLATMGLITTAQTSTHDLVGFSPQRHLFMRHLRLVDGDPERVQDLMVNLNLKVADRYFVGLNLSSYESRQIMQPIVPGLAGMAAFPIIVNPWEGVLTDTGFQLRVDVNNQLDARLHGTAPVSVTEDVVSAIVALSQTVVGDLAQNFISDAILPISALDGVIS